LYFCLFLLSLSLSVILPKVQHFPEGHLKKTFSPSRF
jgi:hypothetical protein